MTAKDLADELGLPLSTVDGSIAGARRPTKAARDVHFRIAGWRRNVGVSGRATALWGLGDKRDVPPPKRDHRASNARYRAKVRAITRAKWRAAHGCNPYLDLVRSAMDRAWSAL